MGKGGLPYRIVASSKSLDTQDKYLSVISVLMTCLYLGYLQTYCDITEKANASFELLKQAGEHTKRLPGSHLPYKKDKFTSPPARLITQTSLYEKTGSQLKYTQIKPDILTKTPMQAEWDYAQSSVLSCQQQSTKQTG